MTATMEHFHPIKEVTADERMRITLGAAGVQQNERFLVSTSDDGAILLTPMASIPKRELIVWQNERVRESLARGIAEVEMGKVERRDDILANVDLEDE